MWKGPTEEQTQLAKYAAGGAVVGAVALAIVGFKYGGWHTEGQAKEFAKAQVQSAQIALLAPACAKAFMAQPNAETAVAELRKVSEWQRPDKLDVALVTLPGESYRDSNLARACVELILAPKSAAVK